MNTLILDDSLTGWAGHNAGYDFAVQDELAKRGIGSIVFANVQATELEGSRPADLQLVFHHYADLTPQEYAHIRLPSGLAGLFYLSLGNWNHFIDLLRAAKGKVESDDLVITAMQSSFTSFAVALWLFLQRLRGKYLTYLLIVHNRPTKFFRAELKSLDYLGRGHRILIGAHTQTIADICQDIARQPVLLLPLPFANRNIAESENRQSDSGSADVLSPLLVTYLGMASHPKGFDLVIDALAHLADLMAGDHITFVIQHNCLPYDEQCIAWKSDLLERYGDHPSVRILDGRLSNDAYVEQLSKADLILVPNRNEFYSEALSGVFAEAVAIGKPVIVAEGTHMASELHARRGVGVTFRSGDAGEMAAAIRQAASDYAVLSSSASSFAETWRKTYTPGKFVDVVLAALG